VSKFIFGYHGGSGMPETPEEQEKLMAAWGGWFETLGEAVLDAGNPFAANQTVGADGSVSEDGGANPLGGYSIVDAADMAAAVEMAKGCPALANGGNVEVCMAIDM
jgi:hypothetical protein